MLELLITLVVSLLLLVMIYLTNAGAQQLSALVDLATERAEDDDEASGRWELLARSSRDVLLAADLLKSLAFGIMIVLALWAVPRFCASMAWSSLPCLVVALPLVWLVHVLAGDVLPRRAARAEPAPRLLSMRLAALSLTWQMFRPVLSLAHWVSTLHRPSTRLAEREEIVERAFDSLAESVGMDEPVIEPDEREMIRGVIGLEDTEVREVMVPRIDIVA
ncbi:MAG TPA: hypothetical protein VNN55_10320, partial [bacterium]|nr:hypothetical protein [bacterium]